MTRPVHARRDEIGAEVVEFALVLPLVLLLLVGIVDFGLLFQQYQTITNAAREGARLAVLPGYGAADIEARVAHYTAASGITPAPEVSVQTVVIVPGGGPGFNAASVTVESPYRFRWLAPIAGTFGGTFSTVTLRAVSTMRMEGP